MHAWKKVSALLLCAALLFGLSACGRAPGEEADERIVVRLAAPQSSYIEDFDTNSYKLWLEAQTGLALEMTWLPAEDAEQIAAGQLESREGLPDAYIGFGSYDLFQNPNIQRYGEQGAIIPLDALIEAYGTNTKQLYADLPEYNIQSLMTSADGHVYFMPGFSSSTITRFRQVMWVNEGWLEALGLDAPQTTEDFREMLLAFKENYPEAIPMAGTEGTYGKQAYDYLFNAFVYNDVRNGRLLVENGALGFAPVRDEWREALRYMRGLYMEGLYSPLSFTQDDQQLKQMANDSRDILGAFVSPGITLTVQQNSPEMMERYAGIGPLAGPGGVKLSTVFTPLPKPNGVITSACKYPEAVFKLFDLMLSEEACLMGRYGTEGVDWTYAGAGETSIYGTPATIKIINQLWNTPQNKHLCQIGPYVSNPKFSGGVTWSGDTADGEYLNAQASLLHTDYAPAEYIGTIIFTPEEDAEIQDARVAIEAYVTASIRGFITGERDIDDDAEWLEYLRTFDTLGLPAFLRTAQTAYDRMG